MATAPKKLEDYLPSQKTMLLVAVSTGLGFIGDMITYYQAQSANGGVTNLLPTGGMVVRLFVTGIIYSVVFDRILAATENALSSDQEKKLGELMEAETKALGEGMHLNKMPVQVLWA